MTDFKCRYCKHTHTLEKLAGTLSNQREIQTAAENIALYEQKLSELFLRDISEDRKKYKEGKWNLRIKQLSQIIKNNSSVLVCSFCWARAKTAATIEKQSTNITFTCDNCKNQRTGKQYGLHIENKKAQGIDPRKWSIVCENCYYDEVVPADLYCPRTSEGRSEWDVGKPKYDCLCPPPNQVNYLTLDGETVFEVIKKSK